jgi:chloramphenicol-sensitive protein RarD
VGFVQYLTPILQFLLGVLLLHEPMPAGRLIGFAIVWVALLVLVGESVVVARRGRRAPRRTAITPVRVTDG